MDENKLNSTSIQGKVQVYKNGIWYYLRYIRFAELQMICSKFGFNYGAIRERYVLDFYYFQKYNIDGVFSFETINCNDKNLMNCTFQENLYYFFFYI